MKIKICGVTTPEDAAMAVDEGADLVGLVFADSPRRVDARTAAAIVRTLPPDFPTVGVFRNQPLSEVRRAIAASGVTVAQLHGIESPAYAASLGLPVIKTLAPSVEAEHYDAFAFLVDPPKEGRPARLPADRLFVAGALTPEGVAELIRGHRPYGVDVCRATESRPGRKDRAKIRAFVNAARRSS